MHCPFCDAEETKVIDSRLASEGAQVRRRRECLHCGERFTTYESAELVMPREQAESALADLWAIRERRVSDIIPKLVGGAA